MTHSGSSFFRPYVALYLLISIGISSVVAVDEMEGDLSPGGLYRLEDGVVVIDWSPEVGFSLNCTTEGGNSSMAGAENGAINASLGVLQAENVSSDSGSTSASLSLAESGAYSGGAHLGWASWDSQGYGKGRHAEYGRKVTDLVGVFSIDMQIKLGSNLSSCPGTTEWIPCP